MSISEPSIGDQNAIDVKKVVAFSIGGVQRFQTSHLPLAGVVANDVS